MTTFSCLFVDGEALVDELDRRGFAVASGSACTSSTLEPSHVLAAMGVLTHGNVRVTLPLAAAAPTRAESVDRFCAELPAPWRPSAPGWTAERGRYAGMPRSQRGPAASEVDARGLRCPLPVLRLATALTAHAAGRLGAAARHGPGRPQRRAGLLPDAWASSWSR